MLISDWTTYIVPVCLKGIKPYVLTLMYMNTYPSNSILCPSHSPQSAVNFHDKITLQTTSSDIYTCFSLFILNYVLQPQNDSQAFWENIPFKATSRELIMCNKAWLLVIIQSTLLGQLARSKEDSFLAVLHAKILHKPACFLPVLFASAPVHACVCCIFIALFVSGFWAGCKRSVNDFWVK